MAKLFVIIGSLDLGGTERHLCRVMPKLQGKGLEITVVAFQKRGLLAEEMEAQNVPVLSPPQIKWLGRPKLVRRGFIFLWLGVLLARQRPHIVHFFLPESYILGGLWSVLLHIPLRIMSRRSLNFYQKKHPLSSYLERLLHRKMDVLVGNSAAIIKDLEAESAGTAKRIELIYNGIDPKELISKRSPDEVRHELNIPAGALVFINVANFIHYKGHRDLLEALANVRHRLPRPWRLICVGRNDGILGMLKKTAHRLQLDQNVIWLKSRRDIYDLMAVSNIGISSSHEEGLSNSVLEGMMAGLPMIVTEVGGNPELITHNETGLIVPPKDPETLGAACLNLAQDTTLRNSMKKAGQAHILSKFSMTECVDSYLQLYQSLIPDIEI